MSSIINFMKKNCLELYVGINIIYMSIMCYLFTIKEISSLEIYSKGLIVFLIINVIITIIINIKNKSFHKVDISIIFIIIFLVISTILAYNTKVSLFGCYGRWEGLFTYLYYLSIFYICSYCKNKKLIVYVILVSGYIQFLYGLCQYTGLFGVKQPIFFEQRWVVGFSTNPNFFGAYMLICLTISIGLFIESKDIYTSIFILLLVCCFMCGLLFSNTFSCLVALACSLFILLIYSIKNKLIKKYLIVCLSLLSIFIIMSKMEETSLLSDLVETKNQTVDISHGKSDDSFGSDRIFIWKETLKYVPKYMIHGIGIDNYGYIDNGKPIMKKYTRVTFTYDKAHNEYLQLLITTGIFGLLSFIIFHIIVLFNGFKNSFKNKEIYLLLPVIAYLIYLMFSMSVIEVSPIFYMCMGLNFKRIYSKKTDK